jgi:cytochrome c oxidase subunit II
MLHPQWPAQGPDVMRAIAIRWATKAAPYVATGIAAVLLGGCRLDQSIFAPESIEAERIGVLTTILLIGAGVIFAVVMGFVGLAVFGEPDRRRWLAHPSTIFSGGVVFPLVTLSVLLVYGLSLIRAEPTGPDSLRIDVEGKQWWWRVSYPRADGHTIETANEVRIPVGRPVRLRLTTADVIHSFWVPRLAGKVDMIPGRTNVLQFRATKAGSYRGQCAEYCGGAHALMGVRVVAMAPADFEAWLAKEAESARSPQGDQARRGKELFSSRGCPACHTITGLQAVGTTGPNLTHVAGRRGLAAERLPMNEKNLAQWIRHNDRLKPNNGMPPFSDLPAGEVDALAAYLAGLR